MNFLVSVIVEITALLIFEYFKDIIQEVREEVK